MTRLRAALLGVAFFFDVATFFFAADLPDFALSEAACGRGGGMSAFFTVFPDRDFFGFIQKAFLSLGAGVLTDLRDNTAAPGSAQP
ncbi:MAG TPA: hypothetical protein VEC99_03060 [Clostridia bacterium]|nr:hypothetical protein [Clostridia bacterium]